MKLWVNKISLHPQVEEFTVGNDPHWDQRLLKYDCLASIAHAEMLEKIGILSSREKQLLIIELKHIEAAAEAGSFEISREDEDCHTAIENFLTKKLGQPGKKIHSGRSRNDQILTALRLYYKAELDKIESLIQKLVTTINRFIKRSGESPMPGYTHTRKAMPSSVKLWAEALTEALEDDLTQLKAVKGLVDQSPLGSGAGYGVPLKIDRAATAAHLGFSRIQQNPLYCQSSRGKFEGALLHILGFIMFDLNKAASDLILFGMPETGFFELPENLLTGSSIMPHKQNPDVLELLRAHYHMVVGYESQVKSLSANLISGYHRDFQLLKEPVMRSFDIVQTALEITGLIFRNLKVNRRKCRAGMTKELYTTEEAYKLVKSGVPFREAYRRAAKIFKQQSREQVKGKKPEKPHVPDRL